jgi:integrase
MTRVVRTDNGVAKLKPRPKAYIVPVADVPGLFVRVLPTGGKSFLVIAKAPNGKQVWKKLDNTALSVSDAQERGREALKRIKAGETLAPPESFQAVSDEWFRRHVEAKGLRSKLKIRRALDTHILPIWGSRGVATIKRRDVAKLLDGVEDNAGPVAADFVLSVIRNIFNWQQARDDDFLSPVVQGMRRSNPSDRARDRILSDDEMRAVWARASECGSFGALVKLLLLTGQRREKVAAMRWQDVSLDGTWSIPNEDREKGNAEELVFPKMALAILEPLPRFDKNPYVFAGRGNSHLSGYSKAKAEFDKGLKGVELWQLHDLRRTARSLMSRAGIRPDIAERVLGHAIKGVERTYDRHKYRDEKAHALKALAGLIETVLAKQNASVVEFAKRG